MMCSDKVNRQLVVATIGDELIDPGVRGSRRTADLELFPDHLQLFLEAQGGEHGADLVVHLVALRRPSKRRSGPRGRRRR